MRSKITLFCALTAFCACSASKGVISNREAHKNNKLSHANRDRHPQPSKARHKTLRAQPTTAMPLLQCKRKRMQKQTNG